MSGRMTVLVHSVAEDGLPDMDSDLVNRVAFIWNGAIVAGWPIRDENGAWILEDGDQLWEPSEDRFGGPLVNVTHWIEFPIGFSAIEHPHPGADARRIALRTAPWPLAKWAALGHGQDG